jgi:hypothetical protein
LIPQLYRAWLKIGRNDLRHLPGIQLLGLGLELLELESPVDIVHLLLALSTLAVIQHLLGHLSRHRLALLLGEAGDDRVLRSQLRGDARRGCGSRLRWSKLTALLNVQLLRNQG